MPKLEFRRLYGENIGTYAGAFDLRLDLPGFNLILGNSGAGKSTLWRLLSLLCFSEIEGSNKQKSRTDLLHPIRSKLPSFAAVDVGVDGVAYTISHSRNHPEYGTGVHLLRDGQAHSKYHKGETIERIQEVLGITYQQFVTGIYLPQKSSHMMVSGTSADRWKFVTDLSGCADFDGAIGKLREVLKDHSAAIGAHGELEASLASLQERRAAEGSKPDLLALAKYLRKKGSTLASKCGEMATAISQHVRADAIDSYREDLLKKIGTKPINAFDWSPDDVREVVSFLEEHLASWEEFRKTGKQLRKIGKTTPLEILRRTYDKLTSRLKTLSVEVATASKTQSRIEASGNECHLCGRVWPKSERKAALMELETYLASAESEISELQKKVDSVRSEAALSKHKAQLRQDMPEKPRISEASVRKRLAVARVLLDRTSSDHAAMERYNSFIKKLRDMPEVKRPKLKRDVAKKRLDKMTAAGRAVLESKFKVHSRLASIETLDEEIERTKTRLEAVRMKLREIELLKISLEAVAELKQQRVGAVAEALAEVAARHYPAVRETISFGIDIGPRKFDILMNRAEANTGKSYAVSTRQLSGGEEDKAAIAFMFAIQEIAAADVNSNLLVLDEAAAHMDDSSWDLLLDRLAESAKGKAVFVMSHRTAALTAPVWDRVFQVRKTRDISVIERVR
jgi:DNA repair exonuclease SbcCD ATPase subunit